MNEALTYMLKRVAWKYEINGEYTKLNSPNDALIHYIDNWKTNHFAKIAEQHKKPLSHLELVISEFNESVER